MPRVKIDYIVSFSSEDPENPASNLLAWDISKKKWLCSKGEPSCSIVLQLKNALQINSVQIGAYHSALVEVLVGLSEKPNDPFEVLVPSSVFLSPSDSRRGDNVEKVRSFSAEQLSAARDRRWDRVRVVCSQPYNKHCKYGLSFIHIHSPEPPPACSSPPPAPVAVPSLTRLAHVPFDTNSSDDEEFRPGELFAKHVKDKGKNTESQIRQATSQALKNIPDSATKLTKTPISKANTRQKSPSSDQNTDRRRDSLMYTDDDEQPNAKIDRIVNRHKDEKARERNAEEERTKKQDQRKNESRDDSRQRRDDSSHSKQKKDRNRTPQSSKKDAASTSNSRESRRDTPSSSHKEKKDNRKRPHSKDKPAKKGPRPGPISTTPHTLLSGVAFVLSGYENPRRGALRDQALAMGARFLRDWGPEATHLICAFPNTPKLRTVRSSPNGSSAIVVTGEWIEQCCARRRLLPWQWFATESKHRIPADDDDDEVGTVGDEVEKDPRSDGGNTDDEIEKVMREDKKRRKDSPPSRRAETKTQQNRSPSPQNVANVSSESDVAFVRDERIQGNVTIQDSDDDPTDEDTVDAIPCKIDDSKALPDFFDGYTFAIDDSVEEKIDKNLLIRYVKAYGGLVIDASQLEGSTVDYWLCASTMAPPTDTDSTRCVRADWVWRCHRERSLCDTAGYEIK